LGRDDRSNADGRSRPEAQGRLLDKRLARDPELDAIADRLHREGVRDLIAKELRAQGYERDPTHPTGWRKVRGGGKLRLVK
jgi:hypothetical protein